jgi:glucose-6-phosphate isomerase
MIDLSDHAGLNIILNDDRQETMQLEFGEELIVQTIKKREIGEMFEVLSEKVQLPGDTVIYRMYDGIYLKKDFDLFKRKKLRYDLTLMYPGKLGSEYIKTAGHYHSISDDHSFTYPELYEVLNGEVHFILQKKGKNEEEIDDIAVIEAERGQRIVVPPDYGHVAVNPGVKPLVLANWIAEECKPDYQIISQFGGAAIFEKEEKTTRQFIKNKKYRHVPDPRIIKINQHLTSLFNLADGAPLYNILVDEPDSIDWLRYPASEISRFEEYIGRDIKGR